MWILNDHISLRAQSHPELNVYTAVLPDLNFNFFQQQKIKIFGAGRAVVSKSE